MNCKQHNQFRLDDWGDSTQASLFLLTTPRTHTHTVAHERLFFTSFAAGCEKRRGPVIIRFLRIGGITGLRSARRRRDHCGLLQMPAQAWKERSEAGKRFVFTS